MQPHRVHAHFVQSPACLDLAWRTVGVSDYNSTCCPQGEPFSDGMTTLAKNIPDSLRATQLGQLAEVAIPK